MTIRFWYHLSVAAALFASVSLLLWNAGRVPAPVPHGVAAETFTTRVAVLVASALFLFVLARLILRLTGSDRTTGLLGVYAASLSLPLVSVITASVVHPFALLLVVAALLEALDSDTAPGNAVRSGLYAGTAWILDPGCGVVAAAIAPVIAWIAWPRWRLPLRFLVTVGIIWVLARSVPGLIEPGGNLLGVQQSPELGDTGELLSALGRHVRQTRVLWETDLLSIYGALGFLGLLAATVHRMGPSRRGIAGTAWLLLVVAAATVVWGKDSAPLLRPLGFLLLVVLANTGLAALAVMNPLHAGRRRMIPVGVLFLLPAFVGWVKILA